MPDMYLCLTNINAGSLALPYLEYMYSCKYWQLYRQPLHDGIAILKE